MNKAEFDDIADKYHAQHSQNIAISGETPEYFAEYKIADAAEICRDQGVIANEILDFGSGIGNSIPWFRKYFPSSSLTCADVSARSLELAEGRFPGGERLALIEGDALPFADGVFDLVFTACVFHHIPHAEHAHWCRELRRVTKPGGVLVIFEHNPWNPLTVRAVNTCPFDANAVLISSPVLKATVKSSGWELRGVWYRVFVPKFLAWFRPLERWLRGVGLGAQYCVIGKRR